MLATAVSNCFRNIYNAEEFDEEFNAAFENMEHNASEDVQGERFLLALGIFGLTWNMNTPVDAYVAEAVTESGENGLKFFLSYQLFNPEMGAFIPSKELVKSKFDFLLSRGADREVLLRLTSDRLNQLYNPRGFFSGVFELVEEMQSASQ